MASSRLCFDIALALRHARQNLNGELHMYVVTGITGKVGGLVADALLGAGLKVRAVVRTRPRESPGPRGGAMYPSRASVMPQR